ncbi:condensation domain-containing protein, partial [Streptomyces decoyicus]|uniref:condensation domain-containing protein n=1 Tax=Streptomyces decoyicus TaxID=249567 RepID=UPI0033A9EF8C
MIPLSPAQQRLWFLAQLEGPSATYNVPFALRLTGRVHREALSAALRDIIERHESLRTLFPAYDGVPYQHVLPVEGCPFSMPLLAATEDEVPALVDALGAEPFDLAVDTPLRAHLIEVGEDLHILVVVRHHIASDLASDGPLFRDLAAAYRARRAGVPPQWEPLPVQYADYALWQQERLGDIDDPESEIGRQLVHWVAELADLPDEVTFPGDRARPEEASYRGAAHTVLIGAPLHADVLRLAGDQDVTLFMVVQAAVATLLSRHGAGDDIPLGSLAESRDDEALEDLVGFFANTLVLRTDTSGNPSFRELVARVRRTDLAAWSHADVPFDRLVEALNPHRSGARHPLFQVMLTLDNALASRVDLEGVDARFEPSAVNIAKFDLTFEFTQHWSDAGDPAGLDLTLHYARDLYEPRTAESVVARLAAILDLVSRDPSRPVGSLELLGPGEYRQMVVDYNATNAALPDGTLHGLFTAQAIRTPDRTALICGRQEFTYAELDRTSDALAGRIRAWGVRRGDTVGLLLDHSFSFVVAALAVLKAGGAYVPLDRHQPADRLAWLHEDAGPTLLLTDDPGAETEWAEGTRVEGMPALDELLHAAGGEAHAEVHPEQLAYVMYTSG